MSVCALYRHLSGSDLSAISVPSLKLSIGQTEPKILYLVMIQFLKINLMEGAEGLGSEIMRQVDEAQGPQRQREGAGAQQGRDPVSQRL